MGNEKVVHSSFWVNFFNSSTEEADLKSSLKSIPLFNELTKSDLNALIKITHSRNYVAGEYIFRQADPGIGLYLIREGEVEIKRINSFDVEHTLAVFNRGDFFGELALVDGEKRSASAVAKSTCKVYVIFKPDLDEFIEKYPRKGIKILTGISTMIALRLRTLNEDFFNIQYNYPKEKGKEDGNND